jgi:hypothetical protein
LRVKGTEKSPGMLNGGWRNVSPFSPPVTFVHVKMMT